MRALLTIFLLWTTLKALGQEDRLKPIQAPSSPSSVIIGSQPSTISRPKSWQAVEAAIFDNYVDKEGSFLVPNDFSIEVSPYWLRKDLKIPIEEYVGPTVGQSIKQTFSLSVSSTNNYLINDSTSTDAIGFGFRGMLWQGSKEKLLALRMVLTKSQLINRIASVIERTDPAPKETFIEKFLEAISNEKGIKTELENTGLDDEDIKLWLEGLKQTLKAQLSDPVGNPLDSQQVEFRDQLIAIVEDYGQIDKSINDLQELKKDPRGFKMEFAGAMSLNFPTQSFEYSVIPRLGFWITPAYQPIKGKFEFLGVLRYLWYNDDFYTKYETAENFFEHSFDYGSRVVFKTNKFSAEAEIVGRRSKVIIDKFNNSSKTENELQYLFNFNYRISEELLLSYTIGQKFSPVAEGNENNLVSVVTLNFGIGGPTVFDLAK